MRRMYSKPQLLEAVEQESKINGIKVFEDIKDKDGHVRFDEGEITFEEHEGITKTFAKWSLSGTHLMIVLAGQVANGTTIENNSVFAKINLPSWIIDKIYPTYDATVFVQTLYFYASGGANQNCGSRLVKETYGLSLKPAGNTTMSTDKTFRWAFDLLID